MRLLKNAAAYMAVLVIAFAASACAELAPDTFNKKLATGYATVQTVNQSASTLLMAGKITKRDAQNVVDTSRTAVVGLDAAAQLGKTDLAAADAKLNATIAILTALQTYLATKGN
jgi:hypothetical protein